MAVEKSAVREGNLTSLAGTVSLTAGSQTLSGSGTAFTTAITGPVYLKVGGQYVKVIRVNSDTSAVIETGAPVAEPSFWARVHALLSRKAKVA